MSQDKPEKVCFLCYTVSMDDEIYNQKADEFVEAAKIDHEKTYKGYRFEIRRYHLFEVIQATTFESKFDFKYLYIVLSDIPMHHAIEIRLSGYKPGPNHTESTAHLFLAK